MVMVQTGKNLTVSMGCPKAIEYVYRFSDELDQRRADLGRSSTLGGSGDTADSGHHCRHALYGHDHQAADQPVNATP